MDSFPNLFQNFFNFEKEEFEFELVANVVIEDEQQRRRRTRRGGSVPGHRVIFRDRVYAHERLNQDNFAEDCVYTLDPDQVTQLHSTKRLIVAATATATAMTTTTRRLRAFKRWMIHHGIECSDALHLIDTAAAAMEEEQEGIYVRALCDLKEGDIVATIPKKACLTIKTSGAKEMIESEGLDGYLGLAVALMFEKSLMEESPWAGYLQLLPAFECLPFVWTFDEVDLLLRGTELHETVKEDKDLICEDWKEYILPLMESTPLKLTPEFFGLEQYIAAKSLIASRSFEIDDYHGFGMVPLADLFNHKTGAEDVHFTSVSSDCESDDGESDDGDNNNNDKYDTVHGDDTLIQNPYLKSNGEHSLTLEDNPKDLEMIILKDVKSGSEVFNTYGSLGNAALLHRYGFTEPNNPYDIVNIDLELVLQWSSSLYTDRYSRKRLSLWRRLDSTGCESQNLEYFEISFEGEPQVELLILLYIMSLPEEAYQKLDLALCTTGNFNESMSTILSKKDSLALEETSEMNKGLLLTKNVRNALLSLADIREALYGNLLEDDLEALRSCSPIKERKLYHSLMLRVSERGIIEKLRTYATSGARSFQTANRSSGRKKLKSM